MTETGILTLAYIFDLVIGDPGWLPHPVRIIGRVITTMEALFRKIFKSPFMKHLAGVLLTVLVVGATYMVFYFINSHLFNLQFPIFGSYPSFILLIYLVSTTLATRELINSGYSVVKALEKDKIEEARKKLSLIVGRDTQRLDKKGILKATVETLAENTSDGIIAPIFYFVIGGLPMAMAYKAINTLDSMVGYKNERYKDIGWAAARLDDIANFIPARITGFLIVVATFILGATERGLRLINMVQNGSRLDYIEPSNHLEPSYPISSINAFKIMLTDGRNHPSPNSGVPEAAMAGALRIRLGGPSTYGGILVKKPYIGREDPSNDDVYLKASKRAITITMITSLLGFIIAIGFLYLKVSI